MPPSPKPLADRVSLLRLSTAPAEGSRDGIFLGYLKGCSLREQPGSKSEKIGIPLNKVKNSPNVKITFPSPNLAGNGLGVEMGTPLIRERLCLGYKNPILRICPPSSLFVLGLHYGKNKYAVLVVAAHLLGGQGRNQDFVYPGTIHVEYIELVALPGEAIPGFGNLPGQVDQEPAHRVKVTPPGLVRRFYFVNG